MSGVQIMGSDLSDLGRFSEAALLILVSLAAGPKHGYAMIEDIKATTGIELGAGTLYGALSRLEYNSFVEPLPAEERRRPYRLTEAGAVALRAQLASMGALSKMGLQRLATT